MAHQPLRSFAVAFHSPSFRAVGAHLTLAKNMKTDLEIVRRVLDAFVEELQHPTKVDPSICESPIEDLFVDEFRKFANDQVSIRGQYEVETHIGRFRLDFVLECPACGAKIGIECDGRDFHSADRDSERDAAIVRTQVVDKVYRLRGRDIHFRIHDSLHLLAFCEPGLFSERGRINLGSLSHPEHLREDHKGEWMMHFPFAALREYLRPSRAECIDSRPDDFGPFRPTIIVWT